MNRPYAAGLIAILYAAVSYFQQVDNPEIATVCQLKEEIFVKCKALKNQ